MKRKYKVRYHYTRNNWFYFSGEEIIIAENKNEAIMICKNIHPEADGIESIKEC